MITAKDFTKAEEGVMPADAGSYLCLLQSSSTGKYYHAFAMYSPKINPQFFQIHAEVKEQYQVIGWVQIERAKTIGEQLNTTLHEENV